MKDCQSLQSFTLFGLLTDVSCADRVQLNLFSLEKFIEGDGSHLLKVIFRDVFCFGLVF